MSIFCDVDETRSILKLYNLSHAMSGKYRCQMSCAPDIKMISEEAILQVLDDKQYTGEWWCGGADGDLID